MEFRYNHDGIDVVMRLDKDVSLWDCIGHFENFLRACSFNFQGNLQLVEKDDA